MYAVFEWSFVAFLLALLLFGPRLHDNPCKTDTECGFGKICMLMSEHAQPNAALELRCVLPVRVAGAPP